MFRSCLLLSLVAITAAPAFATTPVKSPVDTSLSRTELQACMTRQEQLDRRRNTYGSQVKQVNAAGEAITQEGTTLSAEQSKVDTKSATAVEAFKQRIAAYDKRAAAYNAKAKELQDSGAEIQTLEKGYAADCSSKTFSAADRDAILAERATRSPATTRKP